MFGFDEDTLEKARQADEGPIDRDMFGYSAKSLNRVKRRLECIWVALVYEQ